MLFVFDINETLLDLAPLDDLFGGHDRRVQWFELLIRSALVRTAADTYEDFGRLGGAAARTLFGDGFDVSALAATMRSLPVHPDVPEGLAAVREAGHRLVALGNSPLATVTAQLTNAGVGDLFDGFYSAEQAQALKPAPGPYRFVLEAESVSPDEAVLVASHDWDVAGATLAGMRTVLVERGGHPALPGLPTTAVTDRIAGALAAAA